MLHIVHLVTGAVSGHFADHDPSRNLSGGGLGLVGNIFLILKGLCF